MGVSWFEAKAFCSWLNSLGHAALGIEHGEEIRLATEAEWERAARGAERRPWPWAGKDENFAERCNSSPAGIGHTSAVGLFPSGNTPEGIADMSGNVWEWCEDYYDKSKSSRVVRGGSFFGKELSLSPASRSLGSASGRVSNLGFRVVVSCSASARCVASE